MPRSLPTPIPPALSFCIERAARRGFDLGRLLAGSGLDAASYQNPQSLVSAEQETMVYRNLVRLSRSGAIGLDLGGDVNVHAIGLLGGLLANAIDLGHAGYLMRRFHPLASPSFASELMGELSPGRLTVRYKQTRELGATYRFLIDRDIRATFGVLTEIFGKDARGFFQAIAFGYPEPDDARRYRSEFDCAVSFGHEQTHVTFDSGLAALPNHRRSSIAYNIYLPLCRDALLHSAPATWNRRVLNLLSCGDEYPRADEMAARLNCSERSLRRNLNAEGHRYSELVDRVRFDRAAYLLTHSRDSVKKIGLQLRYSEPANFVHAFIRWSAMSPTEFRRSAANVERGRSNSSTPRARTAGRATTRGRGRAASTALHR